MAFLTCCMFENEAMCPLPTLQTICVLAMGGLMCLSQLAGRL